MNNVLMIDFVIRCSLGILGVLMIVFGVICSVVIKRKNRLHTETKVK